LIRQKVNTAEPTNGSDLQNVQSPCGRSASPDNKARGSWGRGGPCSKFFHSVNKVEIILSVKMSFDRIQLFRGHPFSLGKGQKLDGICVQCLNLEKELFTINYNNSKVILKFCQQKKWKWNCHQSSSHQSSFFGD
jgi:hypothetical protein